MTRNGRHLLFSTRDSTIIPGDDNAQPDLFLLDRFPDQPTATPLPTVTVTGTPPPTATPSSQGRLYLPVIRK